VTATPIVRARALYGRLPLDVRRLLRPLDLVDEAASFLPAAARAPVVTATEAARRVRALPQLRFAIRRVEGIVRGVRASCLLAMDDTSARYWRRTLFEPGACETRMGELEGRHVERTAAAHAETADLALWRIPWPLARRLHHRMLVPAHVPFWLATDRPLDAIVHGDPAGRNSRKDDARRVRKLGLAVRVATGPAEHERFRRELYEPYTRRRFGDLALTIPETVFRHARRQGWLLLLEQAGRTVAGAQLERWGRDVRILAFGVADDGLPPGLALAACYYHAIEFAVGEHVPRLSLGTVRPVPVDGVFRYKRKWGAAIGRPVTWDYFLLEAQSTPGARAILTAAPLVVRRRGDLSVLSAAYGVDAAAHRAGLDTPGLRGVTLLEDDEAGR
jgi:hypothetical protein